MKIKLLTKCIGAMITDINLADISDGEFKEIYNAFLQYHVIFFREQHLTPQQHMQLALKFGRVEPVHPFFPHLPDFPNINIIETSRDNPPNKSYWHTDLSWQAAPSKCSVLHAQRIPANGGDTIWVSMQMVWENLPADLRVKLVGKTASHGLFAFANSKYDATENGANKSEKIYSENPPVNHPLVIKHPETGATILFANEQFTLSVNDADSEESKAILDAVFNLASNEAFQVRFQWQPYSIAIWDNFATQHYAVTDYGAAPRKMHRISIQGQKLVAA